MRAAAPLALLWLIGISPHAEHFGNELQPFGWDLPFVHCEMKGRAASLIKMIDEPCLMVILKIGMECIINKPDNIEAHVLARVARGGIEIRVPRSAQAIYDMMQMHLCSLHVLG